MKIRMKIIQSALVFLMGGGLTLGGIYAADSPQPVIDFEENVQRVQTVHMDLPNLELAQAQEQEIIEETEALITLPSFAPCSLVGESIERDLTLYFLNGNKKKIGGVSFQVKLVSPKEAKKLEETIALLEDIDKQLESSGGAGEESQVTESAMTEGQKLLFQKQEAIASYAEALDNIDGELYADDDSNGVIYIDSIEAGKYVACYVPVAPYDAKEYAVNVNVKDKIEYVAVETIEQKTVAPETAGDVEAAHNDIPVEEVPIDTVEYVESRTEEIPPVYAETTAVLPKAEKGKAGSQADVTAPAGSEKEESTQGLVKISASGIIEPSEGTQTPESTQPEEGTQTTESSQPESTQNPESTQAPEGTQTPESTQAPEGTQTPEGTQAPESTQSGEDTEVSISINKTAVLYGVKGADAIELDVISKGLRNLRVSSSDNAVYAELTKEGCSISVVSPPEKDITCQVSVIGEYGKNKTVSAVCEVTVKGTMTQLLDAQGRELYLDTKGTIATLADYKQDGVYYYIEKEAYLVYYGWQNLNKNRYFYDKTGNIVKGTQIINGAKYNFGSDGVLLTSGYGIDVSKWQGNINWAEASTAVSFAIIRCGFRGTSGNLAVDNYFERNIKNAKANGVKVGVYFYSRAVNEVQAVEEASLAVNLVKNYGVSLPIYIDMEDNAQLGISNEQRNAVINAFCRTVQNSGYTAGVYANKYWLTNYINAGSLPGNISVWCAQYNTECTYKGRYDIWQYSSKGSVPGIKGNVDLNISYF